MIVDPAQVLVLLGYAVQFSGEYSMPTDPPPQVIEINDVQMNRIVCARDVRHDYCNDTAAVYVETDNMIYIDIQWINSSDNEHHFSENSYIVHELTHWLQQL